MVKSAFRASEGDGYDPMAVVHRTWTSLAAFGPERFVTLFAALIGTAERRLSYVSAGHPAMLLWGERGPRWLDSTGPLISPVLPGFGWEARTEIIDAGDQVLLYTDGVSDVLGADNGGSPARLEQLIAETAGGAPLLDAIVAAVGRDLGGGEQPDDLTLLTVRVPA